MSETVFLEDVAKIYDCPHSTPTWTSTGVVVLRNQYFKDGSLDLTNSSFTDEQHYLDRIKRAVPETGDLVLTREAPMGRIAMIPKGLRCCLGQRMVLIKPNKELVDPDYLFYALRSAKVQEQISWSEGTGSTVSNLRIPIIKKIKIELPSLNEQAEISSRLRFIDQKIELNRKMNETLEKMGQALFRHYFIYNPHSKNWKEVKLADISAYISRGISPIYDSNGTSVVINQRCIRNGRLDLAYARRQSKNVPIQKELRKGDVLINSTGVGTLGRVAQVEEALQNVTCDSHVTIVRPNIDSYFFGQMMRDLETKFESMGSGTTGQTELSRVAVGELEMSLPSEETIVKFSARMKPLREMMHENDKHVQSLVILRDTLLPRLISGKVKYE